MTLNEIIEERHSVRKYLPNQVDNEMVLQLIEAARLAPSAKNRQPWKFFIAKNEIKNQIAEIMENWWKDNKDLKTSVLGTSKAIAQADVLILVFKDSNSKFERSDTLSLGGAIENILLKATELGLGSLWIADTAYVKNEISKLVKTNLELYSAVAIGYSCDNSRVSKKSLTDILMNDVNDL